ncbi:MAG: MFS transporter [Solirubrobacteraceae bacterium]
MAARRAPTAEPRERTGLPPGPMLGGCTVGVVISWNVANTGSVVSLLARHYGTSLAALGLMTTVLFLAELAVMLPGGQAIDRFGAKRAGLAAIMLSLVGNLLLLTTADFALALVLRTVVGLGVGLGFLAGAIYVQQGAGRKASLAGGIYGGVSLSGGGLALAVVPQLVGAYDWRASYVSAVGVAVIALPIVLGCPSSTIHGQQLDRPRFRTLMRDMTLVRLGTVSAVSFGFSIVLGNWVVTLLERNGSLSAGTAGAIGSLILVSGIVGRPSGGALVHLRPDAAWRTVAAAFAAGTVGVIVLLLALSPALDAIAAALVGLAAGIPFGATIAGTVRSYPRASGAAVGAMNAWAVLVIVVGAPLVGLSFSLPGAGRIGFAVVAVLWVAAIAAIPRGLKLG